jgi:hypothetical protein
MQRERSVACARSKLVNTFFYSDARRGAQRGGVIAGILSKPMNDRYQAVANSLCARQQQKQHGKGKYKQGQLETGYFEAGVRGRVDSVAVFVMVGISDIAKDMQIYRVRVGR